MRNDAVSAVAGHFTILPLRLSFRLGADCELPVFKGSMWHGWLGQALKSHDEHAFFVLFGEHAEGQPKPYSVVVEDDQRSHWRKGELIHFTLYLFAEACQLAERIVEALQAGCRLGLGKARTRVQLLSVASQTPDGLKPGIQPSVLGSWLTPMNSGFSQEVALEFVTPLRLKVAQQQLRKSPPLAILCQQIKRRLTLLTRFWLCDDNTLLQGLHQSLPVLGQHEHSDFMYFENWQRFSNKQQAQIPFGGMKGQSSYCGEIADAIPWLQLGELIGIGGKTTFGLGRYRLIA
ncbi:CRISPR system precrRNA processing endoribonuclease RAMP protein Cas6 [Pseudoalteromonas rubra]|uniref:CRISPR-associated protein Cas6 C-terminal domain-containing protein n=1 Tax=Pseudoalteromonas rubra TaxID=43658 RepID=A0A0F4QH75_9GAMM|nr:CRISPR system precrRNA processing endoribonuclease RAMP protein Cas6 [Pseudoalteromonas rubra]KJZ06640.1 hypothetical protein TW77_18260 [Pseudoalteromonas rubra]